MCISLNLFESKVYLGYELLLGYGKLTYSRLMLFLLHAFCSGSSSGIRDIGGPSGPGNIIRSSEFSGVASFVLWNNKIPTVYILIFSAGNPVVFLYYNILLGFKTKLVLQ